MLTITKIQCFFLKKITPLALSANMLGVWLFLLVLLYQNNPKKLRVSAGSLQMPKTSSILRIRPLCVVHENDANKMIKRDRLCVHAFINHNHVS
uniref:Uncharacterized protein n=1 Tax=Sinocyclocheilus grahami TaxID=75366 RepID=A0A672MMI5_SINGR